MLDVTVAPGVECPPSARHALTMTSACGLCGKDSIDAVRSRSMHPVADDRVAVDPRGSRASPTACARAQAMFERTGGLHAAALFDWRGDEMLVVREDVGRHNAVDKVVGWAVRAGRLPLAGTVLVLSGRAGFELVQKASMAGIPVVAAVSAPSSLAVELANEVGLTLVGLRARRSMVVYAATSASASGGGRAARPA